MRQNGSASAEEGVKMKDFSKPRGLLRNSELLTPSETANLLKVHINIISKEKGAGFVAKNGHCWNK